MAVNTKMLRPVILNEREISLLTPAKLKREMLKVSIYLDDLFNYDTICCAKCGQFKKRRDFYTSKAYAIGVYPECIDCLEMEAENRKNPDEPHNDTPEAMQRVLHKLDIPYYDSVYKTLLNKKEANVKDTNNHRYISICGRYITMMKSMPQYSNKTWKDSQFGTEKNNVDHVFEMTEENEEVIEAAKKRFGLGYGDEDLYWLENEYQDWITRNPCDNKAQEVLFATLCMQLLEATKARKEGRQTKDIDKSVQETMAALGIKPSQNDTSALTDTLTFSQLIEKWEEEDPIPEPSEEFKDVDRIGKYIRVWFAGWLGKIIGLNNAYTRECEEEISKYVVDSTQEEAAKVSDEIYEAIFGRTEE